jgi:ribosomal-protein-alanine N-acetyltransferase
MNIMQIVSVSLGENYHPSFYLNLHSFWPEGFIVATINDQIVGFILATISDSKTARILMLGVYPYHRNKGIGSNLIDAIISQCYRKNIKLVQLEVRTKNQNAIQFYLKRKFIIYKTLYHYYKNNDNAYLMYRYL